MNLIFNLPTKIRQLILISYQVLNELKQEMKAATESAVKSMDKSCDAVVSHISIMQTVLESNLAARDDNSWNQVLNAGS